MTDWLQQGKDAHERHDWNKALDCYFHALNANFNDNQTLHYLGTALHQMGYNGAAANILARATQTKPDNIDSLVNLGACYFKEWDFKGAEDVWTLALEQFQKLRPDDKESAAGLLCNLAGIHTHAGDYDKALPLYDRALAILPANPAALGNRSMVDLAVGNWERGWAGYDQHLKLNTRRSRTYKDVPEWDGSPGKTVIVYGEQGLGDEIMFASMIPDLKAVCAHVIFDCHPRLVKTFERSFGVECHGTRKTTACEWFPNAKADAVVAIGSLGKFFRNSADAFPGTPYIVSRAQRTRRQRMRVGISWKGGTKSTGQHLRSFPLDAFAPLISAFPEVEWVSLQYHPDAGQDVLAMYERTGLRLDHPPIALQAIDYDETLNLLANIDLVITVPTTILHAAGALGVPCWVLVQKEAAWRETGNVQGRGERMPWYDSVRLRHKTTEAWEPLIAQIMQELAAHPRLASLALGAEAE